jgi:hypothetical protein
MNSWNLVLPQQVDDSDKKLSSLNQHRNFSFDYRFQRTILSPKSLLLFTDPFSSLSLSTLDSYVRGKNLCRLKQHRFGTKNRQKLW